MALLNAKRINASVGWRRNRAAWMVGWCVLLWSAFVATPRAQDHTLTEYEVKAAFLFNFAKFTEWPPGALGSSNAPIRIGILGSSLLNANLPTLVGGKLIDRHPVMIEVYDELPAMLPQILFISKSERARAVRILSKVRAQPVLTVSEVDGFCEAGGMINFKLEGSERRKVRFEINNQAANRHGLKLSSKLLGVAARLVESDSEP